MCRECVQCLTQAVAFKKQLESVDVLLRNTKYVKSNAAFAPTQRITFVCRSSQIPNVDESDSIEQHIDQNHAKDGDESVPSSADASMAPDELVENSVAERTTNSMTNLTYASVEVIFNEFCWICSTTAHPPWKTRTENTYFFWPNTAHILTCRNEERAPMCEMPCDIHFRRRPRLALVDASRKWHLAVQQLSEGIQK